MTTYIPKNRAIRGSDLLGVDGATGRTWTLEATSQLDGMVLRVNGASLHYGALEDFTFTSGIITFNNAIFNTDYIDITYLYTITATVTTAGQYCSVSDVLEYLNYVKEVPDYDNQVSTKETLSGTTATGYFLSHNKVIGGTYTFYTGTSGETTLTDNTDYTLDKEKGYLTLTTTGCSAVGLNSVYGAYKWNMYFKDNQVSDLIDANTSLIDSMLHMSYQSPEVRIREEQSGKGAYFRLYWLDKFPQLPYLGQISADLSASATTAALYSTSGLMAGDYLTLEKEVLKVDSVDDATTITISRAQFDSSGILHAKDLFLCNYVIEISNTPLGMGQPYWHVLGFRTNFEIDVLNSTIQLLHINAEDKDALASDLYPPQRIFNRIRVTYKYGTLSVPPDIKRLCILMTCRDMYQSLLANAFGRGTDGFNPQGTTLIDDEIKRITRQNVRLMMGGF